MDENGLVINVPASFKTIDDIAVEKFADNRILYLTSYVDETMLEIQRQIMRFNMEDKGLPADERRPIWLYILSYGGELDYMWMMIDTIQSSITPVYTVNLGIAASAAGLIFMGGKKRFMTKYSRVLIHEGSASMSGDSTKVLDASDSYRKAIKKMREYILSRTNIPSNLLNKKRNSDWEIDAQFCYDNGVCDQVIDTVEEIL